MKITHILQSISNPSAGPTYSVGSLCNSLSTININEVSILALGGPPMHWNYSTELHLFNSRLVSFGLIPMPAILKYKELRQSSNSIFHQHGIWRVVNLLPLFNNKNMSNKLVWSPRGMFSEWSMNHRYFIKTPFWHALQKPALNKADCFHVTSEEEALDVRRLGFRQPIALIPNGVDVPDADRGDFSKTNTILFLSRIHQKKGIHLLLRSWKSIETLFPDWNLIIAGVLDSSYAVEMQALVTESKIPRVEFVGGVFGAEKAKLLASSRLFVLPSYSENFGIAVAEALAHTTPVITTVHTPWKGVTDRKCGWCIDTDEQALTTTLTQALELSGQQLDEMGLNGREWMIQEFSWQKQANEMQSVYEWLLYNNEKPSCVIVD